MFTWISQSQRVNPNDLFAKLNQLALFDLSSSSFVATTFIREDVWLTLESHFSFEVLAMYGVARAFAIQCIYHGHLHVHAVSVAILQLSNDIRYNIVLEGSRLCSFAFQLNSVIVWPTL